MDGRPVTWSFHGFLAGDGTHRGLLPVHGRAWVLPWPVLFPGVMYLVPILKDGAQRARRGDYSALLGSLASCSSSGSARIEADVVDVARRLASRRSQLHHVVSGADAVGSLARVHRDAPAVEGAVLEVFADNGPAIKDFVFGVFIARLGVARGMTFKRGRMLFYVLLVLVHDLVGLPLEQV